MTDATIEASTRGIAWRRRSESLRRNWTLFRRSRQGMVGLGVPKVPRVTRAGR